MIQTSGKQRLESDVNSDTIWRGVIRNEDLISRDWRHTYGFLDTKPKIKLEKKVVQQKKRVATDMLMLPTPPQRQGKEIRKRYLFIQEAERKIPDRLKHKMKVKKEVLFEDTSTSSTVSRILKRAEKKKLKMSRPEKKTRSTRKAVRAVKKKKVGQKKDVEKNVIDEPNIEKEEVVDESKEKKEEYHDITENSKYGRALNTYGHVDFLSTKYNKRAFNFENFENVM